MPPPAPRPGPDSARVSEALGLRLVRLPARRALTPEHFPVGSLLDEVKRRLRGSRRDSSQSLGTRDTGGQEQPTTLISSFGVPLNTNTFISCVSPRRPLHGECSQLLTSWWVTHAIALSVPMWILLKLRPRPPAGSVHSAQRHRGPAATHLRISLWSIATSADAIISLKPSSEMGLPLGRTKRACGPADSLVISVSKSFAAKHPFLCKKGPGPVSRGRSGRCGRDATGPKHRQALARRVGDAGHRGAGQGSGCRRRLGGRKAVLFQHEFDHLQGAPGHDRALGVALGAGGAGGGCHLGSAGEVTRTGTCLAGGHHHYLPGKEEREEDGPSATWQQRDEMR